MISLLMGSCRIMQICENVADDEDVVLLETRPATERSRAWRKNRMKRARSVFFMFLSGMVYWAIY